MNINSSFDSSIKILVIGDSGVGKTNFIQRFILGKFNPMISTISTDKLTKIHTLPKSKKCIKLIIWDTAGQEKYRAVNKLFFQKVQGIILIYDITVRDTFERLPEWVKQINETTSNIPVILVGNKSDKEDRIVTKEEGEEFAKENEYLFMEASAKDGKNINNVFNDLSEKILSSLKCSFDIEDPLLKSLDSGNNKNSNKKCC